MTLFQIIARPKAEAIWLYAGLLPAPAAPRDRNDTTLMMEGENIF
jgi:hypothetical protein